MPTWMVWTTIAMDKLMKGRKLEIRTAMDSMKPVVTAMTMMPPSILELLRFGMTVWIKIVLGTMISTKMTMAKMHWPMVGLTVMI